MHRRLILHLVITNINPCMFTHNVIIPCQYHQILLKHNLKTRGTAMHWQVSHIDQTYFKHKYFRDGTCYCPRYTSWFLFLQIGQGPNFSVAQNYMLFSYLHNQHLSCYPINRTRCYILEQILIAFLPTRMIVLAKDSLTVSLSNLNNEKLPCEILNNL